MNGIETLCRTEDVLQSRGVASMYNIDAGKIAWRDIKRMTLTHQEVGEYQFTFSARTP